MTRALRNPLAGARMEYPQAMHEATFEQQLAWTRSQMRQTQAACERLGDLSHVRLAYSGHLAINAVPALAGVLKRGARLFLTTCNPTTVRERVVEHLKTRGAEGYAWKDMPAGEYRRSAQQALAWDPTHTCEMGADLTVAAHAAGSPGGHSIRAALEATGSGINRLADRSLRYPVFNWDDLPIKEGLHNRYMVGLTTWQTFFERTRLSLHGKRVVVVGYGLVGKGVAHAAKAFGGTISVVDLDPARRLEATYAGWHTAELEELAPTADVVATATGAAGVVSANVIARLKPGCFLLNVGHVGDEIEVSALPERRPVLPFVEACRVGGHEVFLLAGGSMANLTAGHGDSLNAFDVTSAAMVAGVGFIAGIDASWATEVHPLPAEVWRGVAETASAAT